MNLRWYSSQIYTHCGDIYVPSEFIDLAILSLETFDPKIDEKSFNSFHNRILKTLSLQLALPLELVLPHSLPFSDLSLPLLMGLDPDTTHKPLSPVLKYCCHSHIPINCWLILPPELDLAATAIYALKQIINEISATFRCLVYIPDEICDLFFETFHKSSMISKGLSVTKICYWFRKEFNCRGLGDVQSPKIHLCYLSNYNDTISPQIALTQVLKMKAKTIVEVDKDVSLMLSSGT